MFCTEWASIWVNRKVHNHRWWAKWNKNLNVRLVGEAIGQTRRRGLKGAIKNYPAIYLIVKLLLIAPSTNCACLLKQLLFPGTYVVDVLKSCVSRRSQTENTILSNLVTFIYTIFGVYNCSVARNSYGKLSGFSFLSATFLRSSLQERNNIFLAN